MARADLATPARRLPLAAKWMARGSMVEGVWLHSHISQPHKPSGDAVPSAGRGSCRLRRPT